MITKILAMQIPTPEEGMPTLWYEDKKGNKFHPDMKGGYPDVPKEFIYQCSSFPTTLQDNMLECISQETVDKCDHVDSENNWSERDTIIESTYGWVEGMEGRSCLKCGGTQLKKKTEAWSDKWDGGGSRSVMSGNSGWSEDTVLAMVMKGNYNLGDAISIVAKSCERCLNSLGYKYGLDDGYEEYGLEWQKTNTHCDFCKDDKRAMALDDKNRIASFRDRHPEEFASDIGEAPVVTKVKEKQVASIKTIILSKV